MNTYIQDELIPIYISLQYKHYFLKFPINPDNLTKDIPSSSTTADIEGIGEVSVPTTPKLANITIKSFFWHQNNLVPSSFYVDWLERWQASKEPALLIVTRLNYSMKVTCENFRHWINAGEEKDIYFELQLKEYRPYGAKKLNVLDKMTFLKGLQLVGDLASQYLNVILIDIPRPTRDKIKKGRVQNPYTTKENDTLLSITKLVTGSTDEWKLLYDNNVDILGDIVTNDKEIPSGTKLNLPNKWVENESYLIGETR
jgi:hypothetical protein